MTETRFEHERIMQLVQYMGSSLANTFSEVRAVLVSVDWDPALGKDLPFGAIIFKKGLSLTPELVLDCMQQHARLGASLSGSLQSWVENVNKIVTQQKEQIDELERKLAAKSAAEKTST